MNLSAIAIRRPVFTVMLMAGLLILGWTSYRRLRVDLFPDVSFPVVSITVPYPGASPADVESLVVKPLEDAVASLNGIDRVMASAREGSAQLALLYKLDTDTKEAAQSARERVAQVRYLFPRETLEPIVRRLDISASPVLTYTLRGGASLTQAHAYAQDVLAPALEQIAGVAAVEVNGGAQREIQVELDRSKLDALRLTPAQIVSRLRLENTNLPAGHFDEGAREVNVRVLAEFANIEHIRDTIVASSGDGSSLRLRDIATVIDGLEERRTAIRVNGQDAVTIDIRKQSGTNTVEVARAVKARVAELAPQFPTELETALAVDQSHFIELQAKLVTEDLIFGACMAILVVLVFMLDLRSTFISALALPTSVIGTFFVIYVMGYSLNGMTLLALSLSIGLLIDDAVVVRENIFRHLEQGKSPRQAALDGTKEVSLSVLATTLSVIAVFIPIAFIDGLIGKFLHQFGVTVCAAVGLSLFVALTLDPMLSARFSQQRADKAQHFRLLKRPFEWLHSQIEQTYRSILYFSVHHKLIVFGLTLATLVLSVHLMSKTGQDFMNAEDHGQFVVEAELPAGTSLAETARSSRSVEEELLAQPEFRTLVATIGPEGQGNVVKWLVLTTDKQERTLSLSQLKARARKAAAKLPNARVSVMEPAMFEGAATEAPIVIRVRGEEYGQLLAAGRQVEQTLRATRGITDVQLRFSPGRPELSVALDRVRAADSGVTASDVALALRTAIAGEEAGALRQPGQHSDVPIRVRLDRRDRGDVNSLAAITLQTASGRVPVSQLASFTRSAGPQVIERQNKSRELTLWATPDGRALGDVAAEFRPRIAQLALPQGVSVAYDGALRMMDENNQGVGLALLLGIAFIYIVLASQFESFLHPLTIMVTLPLAMVGAIMALYLTRSTLALSALIGVILLIGLVTKNAILLVDRAIVHVREHGATPMAAILSAGSERLRPILMTSAAMISGMLPTALATGAASETRAPMGIAIVGGVISSTALSLVVIPVVYLTFEGAKAWLARRLTSWQREPDETRDRPATAWNPRDVEQN